jgi:hypothetical protein
MTPDDYDSEGQISESSENLETHTEGLNLPQNQLVYFET